MILNENVNLFEFVISIVTIKNCSKQQNTLYEN